MKSLKPLLLFVLILTYYAAKVTAQPLSGKTTLTHADTLRGTYGATRDWWNVLKYDLNVTFNIKDSTISGYNIIQFKPLKKGNIMQIDLQEPMMLDSIKYNSHGKWMDEAFKINFSNFFLFYFFCSDCILCSW